MNRKELGVTGALAAVFSLRLLGLFMIYPVFEAYARGLAGANPYLIGEALGIYGLTQGLLQIPFGLASDRFGRKPLIVFGLLLFIIGSAVAGYSDTIAGVIFGRALQGAGAVGSVILALAADLTIEANRTKAMALIGITIGASFLIALVAGPAVAALIGVPGIFWLMVVLGGLGIVVTLVAVPTPRRLEVQREAETVPALLGAVLRNPALLGFNVGIFVLHAILTASFLILPGLLRTTLGVAPRNDWMVYIGILLISVAVMAAALGGAQRFRQMPAVFLGAVAAIFASQVLLYTGAQNATALIAALVLFFSAFNILEASLPSLISITAPRQAKGTAMGVYSSLQFLGIFAGGVLGGFAFQQGGAVSVMLLTGGLALIWLVAALVLRRT
ncbi:MAG: MFS transporter [Pseudolabrys sp.]|nr:MFS transporter [Pseudolabrys sp.]MBV9954210.1 MFS transporter [Pseudolabrys sp.]